MTVRDEGESKVKGNTQLCELSRWWHPLTNWEPRTQKEGCVFEFSVDLKDVKCL